ncbi:hypothetical protein RND81_09G203400 [Saponaria officinalis]|uniref:BTB domain-containing protein n=1 Tax=Saponaria officinalis TaxID=3572 RepID=A0AAW1IQC2_SAPOF
MLTEGIYTDITINTSDGSLGAHRAVLAARSPVFQNMFAHDLQEKEYSTINISDMSVESCQAFLSYLYGTVDPTDFLVHRLALLRAADKYDISDLKDACHESLLEDIDAKNVLDRLQNAALYQMLELKESCLKYLIKFGKIFDVRDQFNVFLQCADRDLITEVFNEVLLLGKDSNLRAVVCFPCIFCAKYRQAVQTVWCFYDTGGVSLNVL